MLVAGKFAWVPRVKLPVKCLWYSGKFTCPRKQFACVLREVLAASKQVNLPVFTGKLHVTQVNCARDLFTCELHVKLPAFAGNFAHASFTVYDDYQAVLLVRETTCWFCLVLCPKCMRSPASHLCLKWLAENSYYIWFLLLSLTLFWNWIQRIEELKFFL